VFIRNVGRVVTGSALALFAAACAKKEAETSLIGTAVVERQTIVVDAQATGAVEPINVIEVKSKASGQITRMPVETGAQVKAGDLLVQIDTRDVKNQYDQAAADLRSARASLQVAEAQKKRSDEMFKSRVITAQEMEAAQLALTQAQGAIVRATTNLDLAQQRMEDATVVAPVAGTIIEKPVALGQVIASATGSVSGGTTLLKMADLTRVRVRALVNETDIGSVRPGQPARVVVDAYPERPFQGLVEKIEPQAVIQQSVTMFPVIVSLDNTEGFLKPGMNGEVSLLINRRENVVAVANDAVKTLREAATAAALVGLNPDSVQASIREQQAAMGGGRGGNNAGAAGAGTGTPSGDTPSTRAVPMSGADGQRAAGVEQTIAQSGDRARGDSGAAQGRANAGAQQGAARRGGNAEGGGQRGNGAAGRNGRTGMAMVGEVPSAPVRARTALVFVQTAPGAFEPRVVRLGASNYDYSEVISGLKEGETVALLAVASLQQRRDQQNDRFRNMNGGPVPGMQRSGGAGTPGGGGGGAAGGARPPGTR
jgi:HlyD family secretion protein